MSLQVKYSEILDIYKIKRIYYQIKINSKHKNKLVKFDLFLTSNLVTILVVLKNKTYLHGKYNIFLITDPKYRVIMSENISDKIVNHLVSNYLLFPVLEPKMISTNIATRVGKGTKAGLYYMKKYINRLKENYPQFYVLKCDIHKFFYSIDHEILLKKLKKVFNDEDILSILEKIINSTNQEYVNDKIVNEIEKQRLVIINSNLTNQEKSIRIKELNRIPLYDYGKGLPIGNMSSQILAIFYLNDLDHFIKEKLKIKCYIRYMDDLVLFHESKDYLNYCLEEIKKKLMELKLHLNNKTHIVEIHQGINFLGYRFVLKDKKLIMKVNKNAKKRLIKEVKQISIKNREQFLKKYNGYLHYADANGFIYNLKYYEKLKK